MYYSTADLCDNNQDKTIQVLPPEFKNYGGLEGFEGRVVTLKLNKSNWDLIELLKDKSSEDKIIVVDVDKAFFGVVGDKLSAIAEKNGIKAIIINGYVRDTNETKNFKLGLLALGTCPLRNFERTESQKDIELKFGGVTFNSGDFIYADQDGILISSNELNKDNLRVRY